MYTHTHTHVLYDIWEVTACMRLKDDVDLFLQMLWHRRVSRGIEFSHVAVQGAQQEKEKDKVILQNWLVSFETYGFLQNLCPD